MNTKTPLYSDICHTDSSSKMSKDSNERVADIIIDSFNEQIQLNNQFKHMIKNMIDSIEYAYPNEALKLKGIIDSFIEDSKRLSGDYMKQLLDTHFAFNTFNKREYKYLELLNIKNVNTNHNENWMKDWMEQADNFRNNPEALALIANNVEGFLHYADEIEGKYV